MITTDMMGFPIPTNADIQIFCPGETWQKWNAPKGKTMCFMIGIGSGGGGGGGASGAINTAKRGGGGGGSGAMQRLLIPLLFLPETLYVSVPRGGTGGAAGASGTSGALAYVCIQPTTSNAAYVVLRSGNAVAGAGTGAGAAGAASTITAVGQHLYGMCGIYNSIAGKAGAASVAGAKGASNTLLTASILNGGAGGGSTDLTTTEYGGGDQIGAGIYPTLLGGVGASAPGNPGLSLTSPFFGYGGTGGATAAAAGVGGQGGSGGCPGGGGGGGGAGITGGRGGTGGDGIVIIVAW